MSFLTRLLGRRKPGRGPAYATVRPVVLDPWTRGVSDVSKLPTLPYFGYKFLYELFLYSDVLRLVIRSLVQETVRKGLMIVPRFAVKCTVCGTEYDTRVSKCSVCRASGEKYFREPNEQERKSVETLIRDVNSNDQTLLEVLAELDMDLNIYDNAFLAVTKQYFFNDVGEIVGAEVKEVLRASPEIMEMIIDSNGIHGRMDDGRLVMTCIEHRDMVEIVDEKLAEQAKCKICARKLYVAYFRARKGSVAMAESTYVYYVNGEILHIKKFTHGIGYGLSPIYSIWMKILTLMKQDYFILTAYSLERPPKALLVLRGNIDSIQKAWTALKKEAETNPHMIYPLIVEPTPGENVSKVAEYIDLSFTSKDIDFIAYRDEVRRTIGALYGVMPIFSGDTSAGVGLANEGLQIVVTNRAVEREQALFNEKVLSWLCKQLGLNDWEIKLYPNEARDVVARIQRERMRIDNALLMKQLGYVPEALKTEDGIDFEYVDARTGSELSSGLAAKVVGVGKPLSERKISRFEGEPEHGRPRIDEQRFEGEELARRPKTQSFILSEDGSLVPEEDVGEKGLERLLEQSGEVGKQVSVSDFVEVPSEYRRYVRPSDLTRLPKGVRVHRGPKGGFFIDVRDLSRLGEEAGVETFREEEESLDRFLSDVHQDVSTLASSINLDEYKSMLWLLSYDERTQISRHVDQVSESVQEVNIEEFRKNFDNYVSTLVKFYEQKHGDSPITKFVEKHSRMIAMLLGYAGSGFHSFARLLEVLEKRVNGNGRLGRVDVFPTNMEFFESAVETITDDEYLAWRELNKELFKQHVLKGKKYTKLYRGVSLVESNEMLMRMLAGEKLVVPSYVLSFSVSKYVAEKFATPSDVIIWVLEKGDRVVGGWWVSSDDYDQLEKEVMIVGDTGGVKVSGVEFLKKDKADAWYVLSRRGRLSSEEVRQFSLRTVMKEITYFGSTALRHYKIYYFRRPWLRGKLGVSEETPAKIVRSVVETYRNYVESVLPIATREELNELWASLGNASSAWKYDLEWLQKEKAKGKDVGDLDKHIEYVLSEIRSLGNLILDRMEAEGNE